MNNVWMRALGLAACLGLTAVSAQAADNKLFAPFDGSFNKAAGDSTYRVLADSPSTASLFVVKANASMVQPRTAEMTLNLGAGLDLRAHRVDSYTTRDGVVVWSGVLEDPGTTYSPLRPDQFAFDPINSVTMVRNGQMITGNLHFAGEWYKIRPLRSGGHAIIHVDVQGMPADHPPSYAKLPIIPMKTVAPSKVLANTTIRVQVNYTPKVKSLVADITGLINLAVAESNTGYSNSSVQITLVLANAAQTTYTESSTFNTDLSRYQSTTDAYMNEIHTSRNSTAADVNVLLINNTQYCGLASGIGSSASTAFVTVYWDCATGYYSFAHELGHLQSARHDPANDPSTTPYAYGHGYQYNGSPKWRTIMAYDCSGGCPRLDYWSNPTKLYNGVPMGTTATNDNARVLNNTRATVAAFR